MAHKLDIYNLLKLAKVEVLQPGSSAYEGFLDDLYDARDVTPGFKAKVRRAAQSLARMLKTSPRLGLGLAIGASQAASGAAEGYIYSGTKDKSVTPEERLSNTKRGLVGGVVRGVPLAAGMGLGSRVADVLNRRELLNFLKSERFVQGGASQLQSYLQSEGAAKRYVKRNLVGLGVGAALGMGAGFLGEYLYHKKKQTPYKNLGKTHRGRRRQMNPFTGKVASDIPPYDFDSFLADGAKQSKGFKRWALRNPTKAMGLLGLGVGGTLRALGALSTADEGEVKETTGRAALSGGLAGAAAMAGTIPVLRLVMTNTLGGALRRQATRKAGRAALRKKMAPTKPPKMDPGPGPIIDRYQHTPGGVFEGPRALPYQ